MIPAASLPFSTPAPKLGRLLVVDDEAELMTALREMLTRQGYEVAGFASGEQALEALREGEFDLLLTDLMMPGLDGIALLRAGLEIDPHLVGIIMTGQGTVQTAVEAMKTGAFDYVLKPFKLSAVLPILSRALDVRRLRIENVQLRETVAIYELSQAIAFTLDLNTILNKAADAALQQCEADEASIMLPTPEGKELYVAAVRGEQRAHLLGARVPFEQSIAGWVARRREPVNLQGEVRDARFTPIHPRPEIQSAISIPMLAGNQLVGVLNVNATRRRRRFTLGQVKALSILVSTAAAALENAWLHAQVQEAEERFRRLAENARDLIYRYRFIPARGFEYVSPAATAITGYTPEEHYADPELGFKLVHPDDRPLLEAANRGEALSGAPLTLRWVRKDGSLVWTEQQNVPIYDEAGRLVAVEGIARDITERKQAEEAQREAEAKFRTLVEQIPAITYIAALDEFSRAAYVSPQIRALGFTPDEWITGLWATQLHPGDRERVLAGVRRSQAANEPFQSEYRLLTRDGQARWYRDDAVIVRDAQGQPRFLQGVMLDITESKQAEAAVRESEARLRTILENMPVMLNALDEAYNIIAWNRECERVTGYSAEEIFSHPNVAELLYPDPAYRERMQAALAASGDDYRDWEWATTCKDGSVKIVAWSNISSRFPVPGWARWGVGVDLTERKQRERELGAIAAVSAALRTAGTRAEMAPIILEQVMGLLDASAAALALLDPTTRELVVESGRGELAGAAGQRVPPGAGIGGQVVATGQPYVSDDAGADPHFYQLNWRDKARAAACVPLIARQQVFGVLWAGRAVHFAGEEVRVLSAIADMAGNAIQRAALHEETQRNLERLAALRTIDAAISSSLDLRLTLDVLLDQVMTQLGVDATTVLLFNPYLQSLEYAAGRGFLGKDVEHTRLRLGQGYAGRAALERRTISLPDLSNEEPDLARALTFAGEGFRAYYGVPLIAKGQVEGVLEILHRAPLMPDPEWLDFLEALAGQAAIAIDSAQLFDKLQRSNLQLSVAYDATIEGWSRALDLRDKETEGHTRRVTETTLRLARAMGLGEEELVHVRRGALLHDIGKMGVPDGILLKPGPLTDGEWVMMRKHPVYAYEMLAPIVYLRPALDIPYCHHEKWDGTGYPRGLRGEAIPLAARIFAVVDVWDALRSDRPYRPGWPEAKVREHIRALAGTHFDPAAVEVFLRLADEFRSEASRPGTEA